MTRNAADVLSRREQQATDGKNAWNEYLSEQKSGYARTARLRAARLAKEAAETAVPTEAPSKSKAKRNSKAKGSSNS